MTLGSRDISSRSAETIYISSDATPKRAWEDAIMAIIAFIGLGHMGRPMADNLVKAGHAVRGYDVAAAAVEAFGAAGGQGVGALGEAVDGADIVITMLPAGPHVRRAFRSVGRGPPPAPPGGLPPHFSSR